MFTEQEFEKWKNDLVKCYSTYFLHTAIQDINYFASDNELRELMHEDRTLEEVIELVIDSWLDQYELGCE